VSLASMRRTPLALRPSCASLGVLRLVGGYFCTRHLFSFNDFWISMKTQLDPLSDVSLLMASNSFVSRLLAGARWRIASRRRGEAGSHLRG
jgi:hypothetical protein